MNSVTVIFLKLLVINISIIKLKRPLITISNLEDIFLLKNLYYILKNKRILIKILDKISQKQLVISITNLKFLKISFNNINSINNNIYTNNKIKIWK